MSVLQHVPRIIYQYPLNKVYGIRKNDFWDLILPERSREVRAYTLGLNIVCFRGGSQVNFSEVKLVIDGIPSGRLSLGLLDRRTPDGVVNTRLTRSISIRHRKWRL